MDEQSVSCRRSPRRIGIPRFGRATCLVLFSMTFALGQTVDCSPPSPPPQVPDFPIALDCVIGGTQVFAPIDMSVDPDRFAESLVSLRVDIDVSIDLPQDVFCALVADGYVSGDPVASTATTNIGASQFPDPPVSVGTAAPSAVMDFGAACAGDLGPEVTLDFVYPMQTVWPDGSGPMSFWLTAQSFNIGFTNVTLSDASILPSLSLVDVCTPTDKSEPPNGTTDDEDDSPRIAADKDGDGTVYEAFAAIQDQVQVAVSGTNPCAGCDDGNECTANMCDPGDGICTHPIVEDFTACDFDGDAGACIQGVCQQSQTKSIPIACSNSVTTQQSTYFLDLTVAAPTIVGGQSPQDFDATFEGNFVFPEFFLDAGQGAVPGGIMQAELVELVATVQTRRGAAGPDVPLGPDVANISPGVTTLCNIPAGVPCSVDNDCAGGFGSCNQVATLIDYPTSTDCAPGGVCEGVGKTGTNSQCALNGFCITGDLVIPLAPSSASFTPDSSGVVLFGWADQGVPGLVTCPSGDPEECDQLFHVAGSYQTPPAVFADPTAPLGIRVNSSGLFIPLQCAMAEPGGVCSSAPNLGCLAASQCPGSAPCDLTVEDVVMPTPDAALIYLPITEPGAVSCGGANCNDNDPCTVDSCGAGDVCVNSMVPNGDPCISNGNPGVCLVGVCAPVCGVLSCNDGQGCTADTCDPANSRCINTPLADLSGCDFGGNPGLCTSGTCVGACDLLDCDDGDDCTTDTCDPVLGSCSNVTAPDSTPCDFGGLPGLCVAGVCEDAALCAGVDCDDGNVCTDDTCDPQTGLCDNIGVTVQTPCDFSGLPGLCSVDTCVSACDLLDCDDGNSCTDDLCDPFAGTCGNGASADGSVCDAGFGVCLSGACQSAAPVFTSKTTTATLNCGVAVGGPQSPADFELTVATTPVIGGAAPRDFTAEFSAVVPYPESFLDALQTLVVGGVAEVELARLNTFVSVRSGTEGPDIVLEIDESQIQVETNTFCNITNEPCVDNSDCMAPFECLPYSTVDLPTSSDCGPGGVCDGLGKTGAGSQCENNGFCVSGGLGIPMGVQSATYTPDTDGVVAFSWADAVNTFAYILTEPAVQQVFCTIGSIPSSAVPYFPIVGGAIPCGAADCNDGLSCTTDSCALPAGVCENTMLPNGSLCDLSGSPGACQVGTCVPVCNTVNCDDGNPCTAESCDPNDGLCDTTILDGANCDLGGTAGICVQDSCQAICDVVGCDDGNECTGDVCDLATGNCTNTPAADGTVCDFAGQPGVCVSGQCEDADLCAGVNCDDGNACTADSCDPQTGLCDNDSVSGSCNFGGLPGACVDGTCASECAITDCDDDEDCTDDICDEVSITCSHVTSTDDTFCDSGYGRCQTGVCQAIPAGEFTTQSQVVTVACTNSVTTTQTVFANDLTVRATDIFGGPSPEPFAAEFSGTVIYPEFFLNAGQGAVPGGVTQGELVEVVSTVQVRSGATGPDVPLVPDGSAITPGSVLTCTIPQGVQCTNDFDCAGGFGMCNVSQLLIDFPTSTDCAPGGVCDGLGKTGPGSQCGNNGFCITGDLAIPLAPQIAIYTPDASGDVLFGWADQGVPGLVTCPAAAPDCQQPFMPDGCYDLPEAVFANPTAPVGVRMNQMGLFVPLQCAGASAGGICASGEGCIVSSDCAVGPCAATADVVCPTQDAGLISFPIN
ncbi:MAG: hypothetical protein AAF500_04615 [Myxococcota bacterium]